MMLDRAIMFMTGGSGGTPEPDPKPDVSEWYEFIVSAYDSTFKESYEPTAYATNLAWYRYTPANNNLSRKPNTAIQVNVSRPVAADYAASFVSDNSRFSYVLASGISTIGFAENRVSINQFGVTRMESDRRFINVTNYPQYVCFDNLKDRSVDRSMLVGFGEQHGLYRYAPFLSSTYYSRAGGPKQERHSCFSVDGGVYVVDGLAPSKIVYYNIDSNNRIVLPSTSSGIVPAPTSPLAVDSSPNGDFLVVHTNISSSTGGLYVYRRVGEKSYTEIFYTTITLSPSTIKRKTIFSPDSRFFVPCAPAPNGALTLFEYQNGVVTIKQQFSSPLGTTAGVLRHVEISSDSNYAVLSYSNVVHFCNFRDNLFEVLHTMQYSGTNKGAYHSSFMTVGVLPPLG